MMLCVVLSAFIVYDFSFSSRHILCCDKNERDTIKSLCIYAKTNPNNNKKNIHDLCVCVCYIYLYIIIMINKLRAYT